jgi:hypothetical protein
MRTPATVSMLFVSLLSCSGAEVGPGTGPTGGTGGGAGVTGGGTGTGGSGPGTGGTGLGGAGGDNGGGANQFALYESGTRIKAKVGKTADGAKEFRGWFDTKRNEPCSFSQGPDGKLRCLPTEVISTMDSFFVDPGCTKPPAGTFCSSSVPKYVRVTLKPDVCSAAQSDAFHQIGPPIQIASLYQMNSATKMCELTSSIVRESYKTFRFYGIGDVVPLAEFQEMTEAVE